ncbi:MAG: endo alpha-1,4 polygalactosaminidase [Alkalibacterium sp.]|nr:endo alpha-1,4 polygalactosaminidase [Alkalibacterium sp.]
MIQIERDISDESRNDFDYGVFLSLTGREAVVAAENYQMVVIDAQNLSENEIAEMQDRGQLVYSYLNIGSLETFRTYFEEFEHLTLKPYINWDNEFWIDASTEEWQEFVSVELASDYLEKGLDGFWVDNADVYYQFPTEEMYEGVEQIMLTLMEYEKPVVINGGDQFVQQYLERNNQIDDILTGVNQETVFSSINFVDRTLGVQNEMTRQYYLDLSELGQNGGIRRSIFLNIQRE